MWAIVLSVSPFAALSAAIRPSDNAIHGRSWCLLARV